MSYDFFKTPAKVGEVSQRTRCNLEPGCFVKHVRCMRNFVSQSPKAWICWRSKITMPNKIPIKASFGQYLFYCFSPTLFDFPLFFQKQNFTFLYHGPGCGSACFVVARKVENLPKLRWLRAWISHAHQNHQSTEPGRRVGEIWGDWVLKWLKPQQSSCLEEKWGTRCFPGINLLKDLKEFWRVSGQFKSCLQCLAVCG